MHWTTQIKSSIEFRGKGVSKISGPREYSDELPSSGILHEPPKPRTSAFLHSRTPSLVVSRHDYIIPGSDLFDISIISCIVRNSFDLLHYILGQDMDRIRTQLASPMKKKRGNIACANCRARKVRCNVEGGIPCHNCKTDKKTCFIVRRKRRSHRPEMR